ncbi:hypothetical protein L209DRAFT_255952 [Thermothelomyces heterothallicus CBS 203.75]
MGLDAVVITKWRNVRRAEVTSHVPMSHVPCPWIHPLADDGWSGAMSGDCSEGVCAHCANTDARVCSSAFLRTTGSFAPVRSRQLRAKSHRVRRQASVLDWLQLRIQWDPNQLSPRLRLDETVSSSKPRSSTLPTDGKQYVVTSVHYYLPTLPTPYLSSGPDTSYLGSLSGTRQTYLTYVPRLPLITDHLLFHCTVTTVRTRRTCIHTPLRITNSQTSKVWLFPVSCRAVDDISPAPIFNYPEFGAIRQPQRIVPSPVS